MSILEAKALEDLKWNYNYNLSRFYKGCEYCNKHIEEADKWMPELFNILDNINLLIYEINNYIIMTNEQIEKGF